jgi:uncharacterized membrane protein
MIKLFSPLQIALGSFIGGPMALAYFLKTNFDALGQKDKSLKALLFCAAFLIVAIVAMPLLSPIDKSLLQRSVYALVAFAIAYKYLPKKSGIKNSDLYAFQSRWTVLGVGVFSAVFFMILSAVIYLALIRLGLVSFS